MDFDFKIKNTRLRVSTDSFRPLFSLPFSLSPLLSLSSSLLFICPRLLNCYMVSALAQCWGLKRWLERRESYLHRCVRYTIWATNLLTCHPREFVPIHRLIMLPNIPTFPGRTSIQQGLACIAISETRPDSSGYLSRHGSHKDQRAFTDGWVDSHQVGVLSEDFTRDSSHTQNPSPFLPRTTPPP